MPGSATRAARISRSAAVVRVGVPSMMDRWENVGVLTTEDCWEDDRSEDGGRENGDYHSSHRRLRGGSEGQARQNARNPESRGSRVYHVQCGEEIPILHLRINRGSEPETQPTDGAATRLRLRREGDRRRDTAKAALD